MLSITASLHRLHLRRANVLQCLFAQNIGIALTGFSEIDDLVGDGLFDEIVGAVGRSAMQVISKATPRTRLVSGSYRSPLRNGVIGMTRSPLA